MIWSDKKKIRMNFFSILFAILKNIRRYYFLDEIEMKMEEGKYFCPKQNGQGK
jgi:hypothetical protein